MLFYSEQGVELAVGDVQGALNLLVHVLFNPDVVKGAAGNTEVALSLGVQESPKLHLNVNVGEIFIL
mgnify:CR=1 FL=1